MEIAKYNDMMAHLTRKRLAEGNDKPQIVPPPKPPKDPFEIFKEQSDLFLQASFATTSKDYFNGLIEKEYQKAREAGVSAEDALGFLKERSQMYRTLIDEGRRQGEPARFGPTYGNGRENKAIGGGVIEGEDLGTREGFADLVLTKEHKKNIKMFEEKTGEKYNEQNPQRKFSIRQGKLKFTQQAVTDPERIKKIKEFIKNFKKENNGELPTKNEIRKHFQATTGKDVQKVLKYLTEEKELKLPSGLGMASLNVVDDDIKKLLSNKRILNALDKNQFPTDEVIESVLGVDRTIAETRSVDLANFLKGTRKIRAYEAPKKYKKLAINFLNQQQDSGSSFVNTKTKRSRAYYEKEFSEMMNLPKNLDKIREDILKKITNIIPETKGLLAVDEIAGITSSMRRGSGPYAIFGQVLGGDFNTETKGLGIDKAKGMLEKKLTTSLLKGNPERVVEQKKYNKKIKNFEVDANKNNPAKKVKGLKLSFEPPSKTIKNKKIYNQYKDLFDAHYEKHGYSFEVPADRDSIVDISNKLDTKSFQNTVKNRFKKLIGKGGKVGALAGLATISGTGFALADDQEGTGQLPKGSPGQINPEDRKFYEDYPLTTGAAVAATPLVTKTGRKIYGSLAKNLLRAIGSVPAATYFAGKELTSEDPSYAIAGADLLLPELGKKIAGSGSGIMSTVGRFLTNPIGKLARGFTPAGIALQGVELVNQAMKEQKRIDEMRENDPEAYQQFLAEQEDMMRESAAYGGRMGFADGPDDPSKRKFMKIMGGLASLPIIGRFFDVAKEAAPVIDAVKTEIAKGKPVWFDPLVNKVIRMGEDVTERFATKDRETVNQINIGDGEIVRVYRDIDEGAVRVEYESPDNMGEGSVDLVYKKELPDESNPSPSADFYVTELEPRGVRTGPDDYDVEFDGENYGNSIDELMSDTTKLKEFATGQKRTMKEIVESKKKKDKTKAMNESTLEQAEYLESKYGPGDDLYYQDYSDYD